MKGRIFLDHAATTPVREEVLEVMLPLLTAYGANPAAGYASARRAKKALEDAREETAALLGAKPGEVFFTSGGTESDNWALRALLREEKRHIVTSSAEHHAVLETCAQLEREGGSTTYLATDHFARVRPSDISRAVREDTALVSVMYANNETGALNDVRAAARAAKAGGAAFHSDAVAACGHVPLNMHEDGIDMLSVSAHKFGGPPAVGALLIREGLHPAAFLHGGSQERNLRAGTQYAAGAAGLACALRLAVCGMAEEKDRLEKLRNVFRRKIREKIPEVRFLSPDVNVLPGTLLLLVPGLSSGAALIQLDRDGIEAAAGAACSQGAEKPSHVFLACGLTEKEARCVLRISLGRANVPSDADRFAASLSLAAQRAAQLHRLSGTDEKN